MKFYAPFCLPFLVGALVMAAVIAWKRAARRAASVDFTAVIFSSRRTAVSPPAC